MLDVPMLVQFGNVSFDDEKILEGVVSDDVCVSNPCNHNGTCHITWNDFWCQCPRGYTGKTCQEMEFCQLQDCPAGSRCQNLDDGYECIANATFDGVSTAFTYVYGHTEETTSISNSTHDVIEITYRSNTGGTLLHMASHDQHFTVSVFKDIVTVSWRLDLENQDTVSFGKAQPDGNWTSLLIKLNNNSLECGYVNPTEESTCSSANFNYQLWHDLLVTGIVTLGGLSSALSDKHTYVTIGSKHTHDRRDGIEGNSVDYGEHKLTTTVPPHSMMSGEYNIVIHDYNIFQNAMLFYQNIL